MKERVHYIDMAKRLCDGYHCNASYSTSNLKGDAALMINGSV